MQEKGREVALDDEAKPNGKSIEFAPKSCPGIGGIIVAGEGGLERIPPKCLNELTIEIEFSCKASVFPPFRP